jgi:hypothetical protein
MTVEYMRVFDVKIGEIGWTKKSTVIDILRF